jgi:hypothetical protein
MLEKWMLRPKDNTNTSDRLAVINSMAQSEGENEKII